MIAGRLAPMDFPIPHMDGAPTAPETPESPTDSD
jgi:hypothetical protein